jgi:hypothetical protein
MFGAVPNISREQSLMAAGPGPSGLDPTAPLSRRGRARP